MSDKFVVDYEALTERINELKEISETANSESGVEVIGTLSFLSELEKIQSFMEQFDTLLHYLALAESLSLLSTKTYVKDIDNKARQALGGTLDVQ